MSNRLIPLSILLLPLAVAPAGTGLSAEGAASGPAAGEAGAAAAGQEAAATPGAEVHLANIRQLTFGGENAEAYFSHDGSEIIFQSTREGVPCDQIFRMNLDGSNQRMVSTGDGRTTCGYFYPDGESIVYASTHLGSAAPQLPDGLRLGHL